MSKHLIVLSTVFVADFPQKTSFLGTDKQFFLPTQTNLSEVRLQVTLIAWSKSKRQTQKDIANQALM